MKPLSRREADHSWKNNAIIATLASLTSDHIANRMSGHPLSAKITASAITKSFHLSVYKWKLKKINYLFICCVMTVALNCFVKLSVHVNLGVK